MKVSHFIKYCYCYILIILLTVLVPQFANCSESHTSKKKSCFTPNLLQKYLLAQYKYQREDIASVNGLGEKTFCRDFRNLGGIIAHKDNFDNPIKYLDKKFAETTRKSNFHGYYFVNVKNNNGKELDYRYQFALCAVPDIYNKIDTLTYYLDERGTILECDTRGKPVDDISEINEKWKPAKNRSESSVKVNISAPKFKKENSSPFDTVVATPEELFVKFIEAYNNLDADHLSGLFTKDSDISQWSQEIMSMKNKNHQPWLIAKLKRIRKKGNIREIKVFVSAKLGRKYQFKDNVWLFIAKETPEGFKLIRVRSITVENMNAEFRETEKLFKRLKKATVKHNLRTISNIFDFTVAQRLKIAKNDKNTFKVTGLDWLYKVVSNASLSLKLAGSSRKNSTIIATIRVVNVNGLEERNYCLSLVNKKLPNSKTLRYFFRLPETTTKHQIISNNISDFWSAATYAEQFGIFKTQLLKIDKILKPVTKLAGYLFAEKAPRLSNATVPRFLQFKFYQSGQYLVPMWKNKKKLEIINGNYSFPKITADNKTSYYDIIEKWKGIKHTQKASFLENILSNYALSDVQEDAVKYLGDSGLFNTKNILFWREKIDDKAVTIQAKQQILKTLSKENVQNIDTIFLTALENNKLFFSAAHYYAKYNDKGFKTIMLKWLDNHSLRNLVLKNYHFIVKDPDFAIKATKLSASSNYKNLRLFLPYFFVPGNTAGPKAINEILKKSKELSDIVQMLKHLLRVRDKSYAEAVRSCILRFDKSFKPAVDYILAYGLTYLCSVGDAKGIKMLKNKLQIIGTDRRLQEIYMMSITMASRKRFKNWQDCKNWCNNLK